ncbi:MAG TPA: sugar ABC transporter substrate-binding protein [bacterium]|nr:sugar ABC transporter substrate-binding protein [Candidatus Omnitrophota bacterium]HOJ60991.1 sugar ABC transporter substrate-binding protein [bacterium]HXK95004.1 sugar ABC transporter substrate-binding protein [bacterium]
MKRWPVIWICLLGLWITGCHRGTHPAGSAKPRIGFVMKVLNNPFFIRMEEGARQAARELNVDLIVQAADREIDVDRQMQIIENLIETQVDALCVTPSGSREVVAAIAKANQAGIPVLIVDTKVDEPTAREMHVQYATFIGSDNYQGGLLAGLYFAHKFTQPASLAILEGIPGHETHDSRLKGFLDAIQGAPHLTVVASQPANTERDQGYNVCQNILQSHPDIQGLFATNDMMALGAVEAIAAAGRKGQVAIVGFDAIDEARQAIRDGIMAGSVAQFPDEMGRVAVENAVKVSRGESIPETIPVKIELITKDNVDSVP